MLLLVDLNFDDRLDATEPHLFSELSRRWPDRIQSKT